MTTIAQMVDDCRDLALGVEQATLQRDGPALRRREKRRDGLLSDLQSLGCENLCFWLRQELTFSMKVARNSKPHPIISIDSAQRSLRLLEQSTKRIDEIVGSI